MLAAEFVLAREPPVSAQDGKQSALDHLRQRLHYLKSHLRNNDFGLSKDSAVSFDSDCCKRLHFAELFLQVRIVLSFSRST